MSQLSQRNNTKPAKSQTYAEKASRDHQLYSEYLILKHQKINKYGSLYNDSISVIDDLADRYGLSDAGVYRILRKFKPQA